MEFALSEDQRMLQDSLNGFLKDSAPLDTIRKIATGDEAAGAALAAGLDELGLAGLHVPEAHGGLGLGLLDACPLTRCGMRVRNSCLTFRLATSKWGLR